MIKTSNESKSTMIGFRLSSNQLHQLKLEAAKEKRTISNFIKSKLF
jgi:hypothetical protein